MEPKIEKQNSCATDAAAQEAKAALWCDAQHKTKPGPSESQTTRADAAGFFLPVFGQTVAVGIDITRAVPGGDELSSTSMSKLLRARALPAFLPPIDVHFIRIKW